jgi:tetraacyldisaccharide 4'-kinase
MIWLVRLLLSPLALLYGLVISIRHFLYRSNILSRTSFDLPIICVGNLSVGGTGKTPHIEWLIRLLKPHYKLAVLSRGYKRKTVGYVLGDFRSTPATIGDEPFQIARKFPEVTVGVSESRVLGIPHLLGDAPDTQVVLMDDGFQHLPIQPGYAIILTDYANLFYNDWLMPAGTLREFRSAYKRAQCIIVTKCPPNLSDAEKQNIINRMQPQNQLVLFSHIVYAEPVQLFGPATDPSDIKQVLAFSGIAKKQLFINELNNRYAQVSNLSFTDHKDYDSLTLSSIMEQFRYLPEQGSAIITTEKDAVKLTTEAARNILGNTPVFYLPISIQLSDSDAALLTHQLIPFIQSFLTIEKQDEAS